MAYTNDELVKAIQENDIPHLESYLKGGINVYRIRNNGMTPLGIAAQLGNLPIFKLLLEHSNFDAFKSPQNEPNTPKPANLQEDEASNIRYFVVRRDLDDTNGFEEDRTPDGMDALEWDMEIIEEGDDNEDVDDDEDVGRTGCALEEAESPSIGIYRWYAETLNRTSIVLKSLDNDISRFDAHGKNVLHYAVGSGILEMVQYLLENFRELSVHKEDVTSTCPLHIAVINHHRDIVEYLLDMGADVNCRSAERQNALHISAQNGDVTMMRLLIERNINQNATDLRNRSALALAVQECKEDAVRFLLQQRPENSTSKTSNTLNCNNNPSLRLNEEDATGYTPLRRAVHNDCTNIAQMLMRCGARISQSYNLVQVAVRSNNVDMVKVLHRGGALLDVRDDDGNTPLMIACSRKNYYIAKYLLRHGASATRVNLINGMTALHVCVKDIREQRSLENLITLLVCYGADMNATSYQGSVLSYAIILENHGAAMILIRLGADVNFRHARITFDNLSLAKRHGTLEMVQAIIYAGFRMQNLTFQLQAMRFGGGGKELDVAFEFLDRVKRTPLNLRELCRIVVRDCVKPVFVERAEKLPLPSMLQRYIMLKIL